MMLLILILLIILFLLFLLSMVWPPDSPWAPWWRTNTKTAKAICKLANIGKNVHALTTDGRNLFATICDYYGNPPSTHVVVIHPDGTRSAFKKNDVDAVAVSDGLVYLTKKTPEGKCIGVFKAEDF